MPRDGSVSPVGYEETSDAVLLERLRSGDASAASAFYDRYAPELLSVALHLLSDRRRAEDAVHDAFVKLATRAVHSAAQRPRVAEALTPPGDRGAPRGSDLPAA